ncbi:MAG: hypothetical protein NUV82_00420 [Candidatus Komeilibacteria bacterium]|nr:hypothetical protein [Candidatus Komeilibacteria bacterium]
MTVKKPVKKTARPRKTGQSDEITADSVRVDIPQATSKTAVVSRSHKKIIFSGAILLALLAVLVAHFSFAQAKIVITPQYSPHDVSFSAHIMSPDLIDPDDNGDVLAGRKLSTNISRPETFATDQTTSTNDKAGVNVTIMNRYSQDQILIATTRLLTPDNKLFRLTNTVSVPAGGQASVFAQADEPGADFIIPPTTFTIPGLWEGLRDKIYGVSQTDSSFNSQISYRLTEKNMNDAATSLYDALVQEAIAQFTQELSTDEFINRDALVIEEVKREASAKVGDEVESFDLTLELKISTITYDEQKLLQKIENDINILMAQNNGLVKFSNTDVAVTIKENEGDQPENIIGTISGKYTIQLASPDVDIEQLKNKSPDVALTYLKNLSGVSDAQIQLIPPWLKTIPTIDSRIDITINK